MMRAAAADLERAVAGEGASNIREPHYAPPGGLGPVASEIRRISLDLWCKDKVVEIVGRSPGIEKTLSRLAKLARYDEPLLLLGESGVGKDLFAQALYLLSRRTHRPFVCVNCPQYQEGNLTVSELFGHKRGSFTGATSDRRGCFETADGGVIFLDEIGDLPMSAQVMLLRALASGEYKPLGSDRSRQANVRVVAATNRPLNRLVDQERFRRDLLFRLRSFQVEIPPLRERQDDWRFLLEHSLENLRQRYGPARRFSDTSLELLGNYSWPGNVRELLHVVVTGYALCEGDVIEPRDFVESLEQEARPAVRPVDGLFARLRAGEEGSWESVRQSYLDRDLNRRQVQDLIARGLRLTRGSYRKLLDVWRIPADQYQKFMDFLRHHRLKPEVAEKER